MISLTIFWTSLERGDVAALEEAVRERDAALVHSPLATLQLRAHPALARGAVIAVAGTDREASAALAAGVDEVLRAGEVTTASLAAAIGRAEARASSRTRRLHYALLEEDDDVAFALLGAALGRELAEPLSRASVDCERLARGLGSVLEVSDDFVAWSSAVSAAPPKDEEVRRLAARRLAAPTSKELRDTVERLHGAVRSAQSTVDALRSLARGADSTVSASSILEDVVRVLREDLSPVTELSVDVEGACEVAVPRTTFVFIAVALVAHALDSIRAEGRERGQLVIRGYEAEEAVILEFADNGGQIPADLRPDMTEPLFRDPHGARGGLPGIRDRVRRFGGDLIVDSGEGGTNIRVILPTAATFETRPGPVGGSPFRRPPRPLD